LPQSAPQGSNNEWTTGSCLKPHRRSSISPPPHSKPLATCRFAYTPQRSIVLPSKPRTRRTCESLGLISIPQGSSVKPIGRRKRPLSLSSQCPQEPERSNRLARSSATCHPVTDSPFQQVAPLDLMPFPAADPFVGVVAEAPTSPPPPISFSHVKDCSSGSIIRLAAHPCNPFISLLTELAVADVTPSAPICQVVSKPGDPNPPSSLARSPPNSPPSSPTLVFPLIPLLFLSPRPLWSSTSSHLSPWLPLLPVAFLPPGLFPLLPSVRPPSFDPPSPQLLQPSSPCPYPIRATCRVGSLFVSPGSCALLRDTGPLVMPSSLPPRASSLPLPPLARIGAPDCGLRPPWTTITYGPPFPRNLTFARLLPPHQHLQPHLAFSPPWKK
ncbi:hypothetical protein AMTR_s00019p00237610, partial [Amborella trichopoda]